MKKLLWVALIVLAACAKVDVTPNATGRPMRTPTALNSRSNNMSASYRQIDAYIYAVDDSARGVTCYEHYYRFEALSCVKTFQADSTIR